MPNINGRVGQVLGPFDSKDLLEEGGRISVFTPETTKPDLWKVGIQAEPGTIININDAPIKIGKTGIYELDSTVVVKRLSFPDGAGEDTIIDFVY